MKCDGSKKGLEWDQSHVWWIYDVPLYSVSGKWYVLKYADLGFKKKIHEDVPEWPETINKENVACKSHTNITFLKKVVFLEERLSLPKREIPRRNFLEETKYLL